MFGWISYASVERPRALLYAAAAAVAVREAVAGRKSKKTPHVLSFSSLFHFLAFHLCLSFLELLYPCIAFWSSVSVCLLSTFFYSVFLFFSCIIARRYRCAWLCGYGLDFCDVAKHYE